MSKSFIDALKLFILSGLSDFLLGFVLDSSKIFFTVSWIVPRLTAKVRNHLHSRPCEPPATNQWFGDSILNRCGCGCCGCGCGCCGCGCASAIRYWITTPPDALVHCSSNGIMQVPAQDDLNTWCGEGAFCGFCFSVPSEAGEPAWHVLWGVMAFLSLEHPHATGMAILNCFPRPPRLTRFILCWTFAQNFEVLQINNRLLTHQQFGCLHLRRRWPPHVVAAACMCSSTPLTLSKVAHRSGTPSPTLAFASLSPIRSA